MNKKEEAFYQAITTMDIPILTLDHNWHKLFGNEQATPAIRAIEEELNTLVKKQGKAVTEAKKIKAVKKKLMDEIIPLADELDKNMNPAKEKELKEHKKLIAECNAKLDDCRELLRGLPEKIRRTNQELMFATMDVCYQKLNANARAIENTESRITDMRIELKKLLIRKQEMEEQNQNLYSYMHTVFGADVINLFDTKYDMKESKEDG